MDSYLRSADLYPGQIFGLDLSWMTYFRLIKIRISDLIVSSVCITATKAEKISAVQRNYRSQAVLDRFWKLFFKWEWNWNDWLGQSLLLNENAINTHIFANVYSSISFCVRNFVFKTHIQFKFLMSCKSSSTSSLIVKIIFSNLPAIFYLVFEILGIFLMNTKKI